MQDATASADVPELPGNGPTMASEHDGLGHYLRASDETLAVVGRDPETLLGESSADMVFEADLPVVVDAYEEAWRTRRPVTLVIRHALDDGRVRWLVSRFHATGDEPPRFLAWTRRCDAPDDGRAWFRVEPGAAAEA